MINRFYMTRPEEIAKHAELCARNGEPAPELGSFPLFDAIAGGDPELFDALWLFWNFEHAFDDLIDESGWTAEMIEAAMKDLHDAVCLALGFPGERKHVSDWTKTFVALIKGCGWTETRRNLAVQAETLFFAMLADNPLMQDNRGDMRAMFTQAILRCLDGDSMARSGEPRKVALAPAVKCGDLEVLFHMVYLKHGWVRARVVSSLRDYDRPDQEDK